MRTGNKRLVIIAVVLLITNTYFFLYKKGSGSVSFKTDLFAVQDTSNLRSVEIGEIKLVREGAWKVGDRYADPAFVDHLINVLMRVRVSKPLGEMSSEGAVAININGKKKFFFSSNETKTKTFFILDGEGYEMEIPGFSDYVGGIFELESDQWRDRLVYDGSWRTIQKLTLDYKNENDSDFIISFEKDFFKVGDVQELDTAKLMDYLNQFQYFQANERISPGRIPSLDSIAQTSPMAILQIDDIKVKDTITFQFFEKRPQDPFHLCLDPNGEMIAIDAPRVSNILRIRSDFQYQK